MLVSALIPTCDRPEHLARCVEALARQTLGDVALEVVVGTDGADPGAARAATEAWRAGGGAQDALRIIECPRAGYIEVRRRLLPALSGDILLSMNDDVEPCPDFVAVHAREQERAAAPAVIVGASPFAEAPDPTLLDRLVAETSMVFFYDTMDETDPDRDWGFRHCFGLNFSAALDLVRDVGGFPAMPDTYGYDDIELAYRLTRAGARVLFRPAARAVHRHRYRPVDLLEREFSLGVAAFRYAASNPDFSQVLFGRDIRGRTEIDYTRAFLVNERYVAARLERSFARLADMPASCVDAEPELLRLVYEQHLLLKRYVWREGLLREAEGRADGYRPIDTEGDTADNAKAHAGGMTSPEPILTTL